MKFAYLILFFSILSLGLFSQTASPPETFSLQVEGQITDSEDDPIIGAVVQVYQGAKVIGTYPVNVEGKYSFKLSLNGDYTVVVSAQKTVTKKYMVSTRGVPPERALSKFTTIRADLSLFEKMDGIDYSILNQPLQKYMYKADKANFIYDEVYFQQILGSLQRLKELEDAARLKKKELEANYNNAIKIADKAFQKKDWTIAKSNYSKAIDLKPTENYPKDQLAQMDVILKNQEALSKKIETEKLTETKTATDKIAADKLLADAKTKADTDALAKKKADDETARLAKEKAKHLITPTLETDNYKTAIKKADDLFKMKRYTDAKTAYEEALIAKASDKYAKGQLVEIEKLLKSDTATAESGDEKMKALLLKYPSGVTEETISGSGVVIIQRAVNKASIVYIYQKKIFNWGGTSYFRDGTTITESIFEQETKP